MNDPHCALPQVTLQSTPPEGVFGSPATVAVTLNDPLCTLLDGTVDMKAMLSVLTTIEKPPTVVCWPTPSVSVTLKFSVVVAVGVPEMPPVAAFSESPSLKAGVVLQLSVPAPDPCRVKL